MAEKKRLFTGMQPSGQLHIGNYFGALQPTAELFKTHEGLIMVADYHSLTSLKDAGELRTNIIEIVRAYLAAGIDPATAIIFKQSDVPEHTELAWIFECLVTVPFLMEAHAFKAAVDKANAVPKDTALKNKMGLPPINAGLFNYPMLMAADILLYNTDIVPVGADQRQHVEYAREAASKFNLTWGETFKEPKEKILEGAQTPGTDGQKMSKSYKNTIPLFGTKEEIVKAVMSIVTDSTGGTMPANVYAIHNLVRTRVYEPTADANTFFKLYSENKKNYKYLKEVLIEDLEKMIGPMREKYYAISDDEVKKVLKEGGERARAIASAKMADVRKKIGVDLN